MSMQDTRWRVVEGTYSMPIHCPSVQRTPPMYRTVARKRVSLSAVTVTMQGIPERRVVPGRVGVPPGPVFGSGGRGEVCSLFATEAAADDERGCTLDTGFASDLIEVEDAGRFMAGEGAAGARTDDTERRDAVDAGRRRPSGVVVAVDAAEPGRFTVLLAEVGVDTAGALPLTVAAEACADPPRAEGGGRLVIGVRGTTGERGFDDDVDEADRSEATDGARDGGRRVIDCRGFVATARAVAPLVVETVAARKGLGAAVDEEATGPEGSTGAAGGALEGRGGEVVEAASEVVMGRGVAEVEVVTGGRGATTGREGVGVRADVALEADGSCRVAGVGRGAEVGRSVAVTFGAGLEPVAAGCGPEVERRAARDAVLTVESRKARGGSTGAGVHVPGPGELLRARTALDAEAAASRLGVDRAVGLAFAGNDEMSSPGATSSSARERSKSATPRGQPRNKIKRN